MVLEMLAKFVQIGSLKCLNAKNRRKRNIIATTLDEPLVFGAEKGSKACQMASKMEQKSENMQTEN